MTATRLVVGMTGASGIAYGVRFLQALRELGVESHLVMTKPAEMTLAYETDFTLAEVQALAAQRYAIGDVGAAIASGSFPAAGMAIIPCSMKSLAEIATGATSNLLTRAADVTLKERRRLVLLARETPLHAVHLRNMLTVTELGAIVAPPVPAFYTRPESVQAIVDQTVGRVLDLFGLDAGIVQRWGEARDGATNLAARRARRDAGSA